VAVWRSSDGIGYKNKITLRQARLLLRWVNICWYTVLICNQPLRPTQPPTLSAFSSGQGAVVGL